MTQKHTLGLYEQHETCKRNELSDPISELYDTERNVYFTQITSQSKQIGGIVQYGVRDWDEAKATATVMLAAPEMCDELVRAEEILRINGFTDHADRIAALIAKATGAP